MKDINIRFATVDDAEDILNVYEYYVLDTAISFEYRVPTVEEFRERIRKTIEKYPYYVALDGDKVIGYAYAGAFVGREAYRFSAELTIYIDKNYQKQGIGKNLYRELEGDLKRSGYTNLYVCVGTPIEKEDEYLNFNSVEFHKHLGFNIVGEFHSCGYKFNRWYNMVWMEKLIG